MKKLFAVIAVSALALTGCASTCDDLQDASETLADKYRPCSESSEPEAFDVSQCGDNIEKCSNEERESLADFSECIRDLPRCSPDAQDEFINEVFTCVIDLYNDVGEECLEATGIFGRS
jgi:hypothetical protein